jgi:peroxiredoxin Q/BCP
MNTRALLPLIAILAAAASSGCEGSKPAPEATATAPTTGATGATGAAAAADPLKVGDMAPDIDLTLQNGKTVKLSSLRGKTVAVFFYPKDETPGCTAEAQGIRDSWEAISAANITVIGVSMQDAASHQKFIEKEKLPFDLAVDTSGDVVKAFRVPFKGEYASRQTFLIGPDGRIKKVWEKVTPTGHAQEILDAAKS